MILTQKILKRLLSYDPETGIFVRLVSTSNRVKVGDVAGTPHNMGYWSISLMGRRHLAHRLAWLYVYGIWPPQEIDHMNGDRSDNRICNIRLASRPQNAANGRTRSTNTSGHPGVHYETRRSCWCAYIGKNNKRIWLGYFDTAEAAIAARRAAARLHHGKFARAA